MKSSLQEEIKQSKPFQSLRQEAVLSLARTASLLTHAWEQCLRPYGITFTQYNVLRILRGAGVTGLCRHAIASRLVTQVPDVSRLLDRMVLAGLVTRTRDGADRRLVQAAITDKGLAVLSELDVPSYRLVDEQLAHMPDEDLRLLIQFLETARTHCPRLGNGVSDELAEG